ncbi:MAG: hypothetical protein RBT11_19140 [Desulfobacterales bacterium]|jgi:hypothetical protein|nr:hypothetical protein [Desulfobacterales bacterium]
MAMKRERIKSVNDAIEDRYLTAVDVQRMLSISEGQVYMYEKHGILKSIDISVSGNGGPKTRRYSLESVKKFVEQRKIDPQKFFE